MTTGKHKTKLSAVEALVAGDRDLMKALMKEVLQEVLEGEMAEFLGAKPGERTDSRVGYRAGYPEPGVLPEAHPGTVRRDARDLAGG